MEMLETLRRSGGIDAIARQLGVPPVAATVGVEALLPAVLEGFQQFCENSDGGEMGLGSLIRMLSNLGGGTLAADVLGPEPVVLERGNVVLGAAFGSPAVSGMIVAHAAAQSGIDPRLLERIMPLLAMLVGGYLAARAGGNGAHGSGGLQGLVSLIDLDQDSDPCCGSAAMAEDLES